LTLAGLRAWPLLDGLEACPCDEDLVAGEDLEAVDLDPSQPGSGTHAPDCAI
jgi:hypothetical protein